MNDRRCRPELSASSAGRTWGLQPWAWKYLTQLELEPSPGASAASLSVMGRGLDTRLTQPRAFSQRGLGRWSPRGQEHRQLLCPRAALWSLLSPWFICSGFLILK